MGEYLRDFTPVELQNLSPEHTFYVGEVAQLLGVHARVSYRQMSRMWYLGRCSQGMLTWPPGPGWQWPTLEHLRATGQLARATAHGYRDRWATFTLTDVVSVRRCVDILGGADAFSTQGQRRPSLIGLAKACRRLREQGLHDPLVHADIRIVMGSFHLVVGSASLEISTDQLAIVETLSIATARIAARTTPEIERAILDSARDRLPRPIVVSEVEQLRLPMQ
jgi:hypothetical protein